MIASEGGIVTAEGGMVASEGGIVAAEGGMIALEGGIVVSEGGIVASEGDIMHLEGDITSFVGCKTTILPNLQASSAPANPSSRRRFGARGRHFDRPGAFAPVPPPPWIRAWNEPSPVRIGPAVPALLTKPVPPLATFTPRSYRESGIGKILFERIAFPIHIPSAEVDCIPTRNPLFSLGL